MTDPNKQPTQQSMPWDSDPNYHPVKLSRTAAENGEQRDQHQPADRLRVPRLPKPVYLAAGRTALGLHQLPNGDYLVTNESDPGNVSSVRIPKKMTAENPDGFAIGRVATPELGIDTSGSREHLRLYPSVQGGIEIADTSTHGTTVYVPEEPQLYTSVIPLNPEK